MESAAAHGVVYQINLSRGGAPKLPVPSAIVESGGLAGDYHNDVRSHGGPLRAVCLYTLEQIERLMEEGNPIFPGAVGENVTLRGIPQYALSPGATLLIGAETRLAITSYTTPCVGIAHAFNTGDFTRISQRLFPGESRVYARVIHGGEINTGDAVTLWAAPIVAAEALDENERAG